MLKICLRSDFHVIGSGGSSVIGIKPRAKENSLHCRHMNKDELN
jgi:hypothetical protein